MAFCVLDAIELSVALAIVSISYRPQWLISLARRRVKLLDEFMLGIREELELKSIAS
jgi:hypothetical protein